MKFDQYLRYTEDILSRPSQQTPYDNQVYLDYTRLNFTRMNRWVKTGELNPILAAFIQGVNRPQTWIIIAEPWCGDAAPALPFLVKLTELNPLIQYDIQLRDAEPFLINLYLTNGGKSIPKLIVRDETGQDLFTWGPRPQAAQQLMENLRDAGVEKLDISAQLQNWYNADKGTAMQKELMELFEMISAGS
jgi:hypothetical protein